MRVKIILLMMLIVICARAQNPQHIDSIHTRFNNIVKRISNGSSNGLERNNDCLFKGKIEVVNNNTIKYDDEIMFIYVDEKYKQIFEKGIFFPGLITGPVQTGKAREEELGSMLIRNDSITISSFAEMERYYHTPENREFRLLVFYKKHLNPTEYNITLTNKSANAETDLDTFINGAIVSKIKYITIWI